MSDCSSGGEYEENETEYFSPPCRDLYSDQMLDSATQCWTFIKEKYGLDLQVLKKRHNLDMFSYIRMVNYIRLEMPKPEDLMSLKTDEKWGDMKWMTPTVENDALLMYDVFEDEEDTVIEPEIENGTSEHEAISISYKEYRALRRFKEEYEPMMESYKEQTRRMTEITQRLVQDTSFNNSKAIQNEEEQLCAPVSSLLLEKEDQNYATSYSHFSIHHEMLSDQIRTNSYKNAIESNANSLIKSKDILDLGCGTGILSLFCAQAGAKSVTAVDMSDVINLAIDIAHENGLQDTISFRKGRLEDIPDINEKFDIIVSEWMGYFLLFEGMLDSVVDARNKYLKPDTGRLLPNRCTLLLSAVCDMDRYSKTIDFWEDVYGFKMSCLKGPVLKEASVEVVPKDKIISESPAEILNLDLEKCSVKDYSSFTSNFELKASENGHITAICGYFDTFFELPENKVFFTTGPQGHQTHWKQTLFYMKSPLQVNKGDIIKGHISVRRPKRDPRGLIVTLKVMGTEQKYVID